MVRQYVRSKSMEARNGGEGADSLPCLQPLLPKGSIFRTGSKCQYSKVGKCSVLEGEGLATGSVLAGFLDFAGFCLPLSASLTASSPLSSELAVPVLRWKIIATAGRAVRVCYGFKAHWIAVEVWPGD